MSEAPATKPLPEAVTAADNLPTIPMVAVQVLRLCRDEETTLDDLAKVISCDAALSARLLRFSNSSLYNLGQEVTSLQRATLVLGMKTVQMMALSFSLASDLPRDGRTRAFDYAMYWRRSLAGAVAGHKLANLIGSPAEDEAFLCGLLSEIGQLTLARCMEEEYAEVREETGERWPTLEDEQRLLGFHHADIGETLLRTWELPDLITCGVGYLRRPDALPADTDPDARDFVHLLHLAALTVDLLTADDKGAALAQIENRAAEYFDLLPETVYGYLTSLEAGITEASQMLDLDLPADLTYEKILDNARTQMLGLTGQEPAPGEAERGGKTNEHRRRILEDSELFDDVCAIPGAVAFEKYLQHEIRTRLAEELSHPVGLLLAHLDRHREILEECGRETGDELLRRAAAVLAAQVRAGDLYARIGARCFAVVMPQGSPFGLQKLADRLRPAMAEMTIESPHGPVATTITIAGACLGSVVHNRDGQKLFEAVKGQLSKARKQGGAGLEILATVMNHRG